MQDRFENHNTPLPPSLQAEARYPKYTDAAGHIQGVEATAGGLIRATIGSALAAGSILAFIWLPAEYGIDPTGVGRKLGLTEMGEIKRQLDAESYIHEATISVRMAVLKTTGNEEVRQQLEAIQTELIGIAAADVSLAGRDDTLASQAPSIVDTPAVAVAPSPEVASEPVSTTPVWRDEVSYTLAPGQGIDVKLVMNKGTVAEFEWTAHGALLNHDTRGDGEGKNVTYVQGRGVPGEVGELEAAFTGNHGWYWQNRTDAPVTLTLRTRGDYLEMKAP